MPLITITLAVLVVTLGVAVSVLTILALRRKQDAVSAALAAQAREHGLLQSNHENLTTLKEQHAWNIGNLAEQQKALVAELTGRLELANKHVKTLEAKRDRLLPQGDRVSRNDIVATCSSLGLDATVYSGVVFRPTDAPYYAQIDHLIVVNGRVLLVENKYWSGVVIHGVQPNEPALCALLAAELDDTADRERTAVALRLRRDGERIEVNTHESPGQQARRQAVRLREYLAAEAVPIQWIDTCVYYSHRDSTTYLASQDDKRTALVGDTAALGRWIRSSLAKAPTPTAERQDLLDALDSLSLDAVHIEVAPRSDATQPL